jgi:hypothetical protein
MCFLAKYSDGYWEFPLNTFPQRVGRKYMFSVMVDADREDGFHSIHFPNEWGGFGTITRILPLVI